MTPLPPLVVAVDANVAVKLYLNEPLVSEAHTLFGYLNVAGSVFHVPGLFYVECANILWKQVKRGLLTPDEATGYYDNLAALPLHRTPTRALCPEALKLALGHDISAYDACYVALSRREGVHLISADQKLVHKLAGSTPPVIFLGDWQPPVVTPGTP